MNPKQFSWQVEVLPRHIHPIFFAFGCFILGSVAVYCFSADNFFACALFIIVIVFITLEQFLKKKYTATGVLGEKSVIINSQEYKYKELAHFSALDENTILLYKKGKEDAAVRMEIRATDFNAMYNFFSAFLDEKEYEPGFIESMSRLLSP